MELDELLITADGELVAGKPGKPGKPARQRSMFVLSALGHGLARSGQARARARARASDGVTFNDETLATWLDVRELYLTADAGTPGTPGAGTKGGPATPAKRFPFENRPVERPPGPDDTAAEIAELYAKQQALLADRQRQEEVKQQADTADLSDILGPLGIGETGGFEETVALINTVLQMAERVGYVYKEKFNRLRPNQVDTRLRPFLQNPPHSAYPSNHAFQMFCVAEVIVRLIPESPAANELFHVAQRVGENREYAGLHYQSDTEAGRKLARNFSPYLIAACRRQMRRALAEWY